LYSPNDPADAFNGLGFRGIVAEFIAPYNLQARADLEKDLRVGGCERDDALRSRFEG